MSYLGGDLSIGEKHRKYDEVIRALPSYLLGWPHQCRCGTTLATKYRGRWYCSLCFKRKDRCVFKMTGKACACPLGAA